MTHSSREDTSTNFVFLQRFGHRYFFFLLAGPRNDLEERVDRAKPRKDAFLESVFGSHSKSIVSRVHAVRSTRSQLVIVECPSREKPEGFEKSSAPRFATRAQFSEVSIGSCDRNEVRDRIKHAASLRCMLLQLLRIFRLVSRFWASLVRLHDSCMERPVIGPAKNRHPSNAHEMVLQWSQFRNHLTRSNSRSRHQHVCGGGRHSEQRTHTLRQLQSHSRKLTRTTSPSPRSELCGRGDRITHRTVAVPRRRRRLPRRITFSSCTV